MKNKELMMNRRAFAQTLGAMSLVGIAGGKTLSQTIDQSAAKAAQSKHSFHVGMIVYEQMTNLDFVGPMDMFSRVPQIKIHVQSSDAQRQIGNLLGRRRRCRHSPLFSEIAASLALFLQMFQSVGASY